MSKDELPVVSQWLQQGFHRFIQPLLRRHFHAIAVEKDSFDSLAVDESEPLVVYGNHPSWWDPLVCHVINRELFSPRQFYAPIDAAALQKYQVFAKLGFYGVEMDSVSGAASFLKRSRAILADKNAALWLTPEGRFADSRDRDAVLMPGLSHLCSQMETGVIIPLALEYVFWDERLPVCLAKLGTPIRVSEHHSSQPNERKQTRKTKKEWAEMLVRELRSNQDQLAQLAIARSSEPFRSLVAGRVGGGAFYDTFRRARSLVSGKKFQANHGEQFK